MNPEILAAASAPQTIQRRVRDSLGIALLACFQAWVLGLVPLALTYGAGSMPQSGFGEKGFSFLAYALAVGVVSGVVLMACALFVVWPACFLVLRWARVPWPLAAALGFVVGGGVGAWWFQPAADQFPLVTGAYGAVIGIAAARLRLRWRRLDPTL